MTLLFPLREALSEAEASLGIELTPAQCDHLIDYVDLLARWNKTYNLTAIRDPLDMMTHHVIDSLAVIAPLRREVRHLGLGNRLLDVGSGAGLPGLVIGIAAPEFAVTCVDSVGKKAAFVTEAAARLSAANVQSVKARVECLGSPRFDVVTSRAFASLDNFVAATDHLLSPSGVWMAMKGNAPSEELGSLEGRRLMFHVEPITMQNFDASRCLVWIRRETSEHTLPARLPAGKPHDSPQHPL